MRKMSKQPHRLNNDFDNLVYAAEHGRLQHRLSPFYERPAYYGTSQQIGGDHAEGDERGHGYRDDRRSQ